MGIHAQLIRIQTPHGNPVRSLFWNDDSLIDLASSGIQFHLDGSSISGRFSYPYRFDAAITSPSGAFTALYERFGTKALVLKNGEILRELNRSYYYANDYEYPIAFLRRPNGQEILAHCPDEYCKLDIEDAATGQRLTLGNDRKPSDYFFSRLTSSPSSSYLSSAGWLWHPFDLVKVFDVTKALCDPSHLDSSGIELGFSGESGPCCFNSDDQLIVKDVIDSTDSPNAEQNHLRSFDLATQKLLSDVMPKVTIGEMMAVGPQHIVSFHEHPKLISAKTGEVIQEWPHLKTGSATSSFAYGRASTILALDPSQLRFAVADNNTIHVVLLKID